MFFYPPRLAVLVVGAFSAVPYVPLPPPPVGVWVVFGVLALRPSRGCSWRHVVSRGRLSFWCCVLVKANRRGLLCCSENRRVVGTFLLQVISPSRRARKICQLCGCFIHGMHLAAFDRSLFRPFFRTPLVLQTRGLCLALASVCVRAPTWPFFSLSFPRASKT